MNLLKKSILWIFTLFALQISVPLFSMEGDSTANLSDSDQQPSGRQRHGQKRQRGDQDSDEQQNSEESATKRQNTEVCPICRKSLNVSPPDEYNQLPGGVTLTVGAPVASTTSCGHEFHTACLLCWILDERGGLREDRDCPMCRQKTMRDIFERCIIQNRESSLSQDRFLFSENMDVIHEFINNARAHRLTPEQVLQFVNRRDDWGNTPLLGIVKNNLRNTNHGHITTDADINFLLDFIGLIREYLTSDQFYSFMSTETEGSPSLSVLENCSHLFAQAQINKAHVYVEQGYLNADQLSSFFTHRDRWGDNVLTQEFMGVCNVDSVDSIEVLIRLAKAYLTADQFNQFINNVDNQNKNIFGGLRFYSISIGFLDIHRDKKRRILDILAQYEIPIPT